MASVNRDILCSKEKKWPAQNRNSRRHPRVNKGLTAELKEVSYSKNNNSKRMNPYVKICGKNCDDCFIKKERISEENGGNFNTGKNVSHSTKDVVIANESLAKTIPPSKLTIDRTKTSTMTKEVPKPKKTRRGSKITITDADGAVEKIDESPSTRRASSRIQKRSVRSNVQTHKVEVLMSTENIQGKKVTFLVLAIFREINGFIAELHTKLLSRNIC